MSGYGIIYYQDIFKATRAELYNISATNREYFEQEIERLKELKPDTVEEIRLKYIMMADAYRYKRYYDAFCKLYCYA